MNYEGYVKILAKEGLGKQDLFGILPEWLTVRVYSCNVDKARPWDDLTLELADEKKELWAIRKGGSCWTRESMFEWEPSPSNRDEEFLARARWSFKEAVAEVEKLRAKWDGRTFNL